MQKEWYKIINQTSGLPVIYVYGILMPFADENTVSYADFQAAFRQLEGYNAACEIRINCIGGSIMEGLAIYDMIRASAMTVTTICEGVAASMGAILFEAGDQREMYPNSRLMTHRAQGGISGDADVIRAYADQVESCEESIKAILKERTGLDDKGIAALIQTNVDNWITAEDAVNKYHLADRIIPAIKDMATMPKNLAGKKPEEVYKLFYNQLTQNLEMNKLKASLVVLLAMNGVTLSLEDSDEKFYDEVKKILTSKDEQITNIAKTNAEAIVNMAMPQGTVDEKAPFVALGTTNPALLVTMLAKIAPAAAAPAAAAPAAGTTIVNINPNLKQAGDATADDERAKWTYFDYSKNDPTALAAMETADPDKFNKLVLAVETANRNNGFIS